MVVREGTYAERPGKYFFLNKTLYKKVLLSKRQNLMSAIRVSDGERVVFLWSDIAKNGQRAFPVSQVGEILNCSPNTVFTYFTRGITTPPTNVAQPDHPIPVFRNKRLYSEDQILEIWEAMANSHYGRPRSDGIIVPRKTLPEKAEVLNKIRGGTVLYYKDEAGDYVPLWRAT